MGIRQCTRTFKIDVIRRKMRELREGDSVIQWMGISFDESHRMKGSRDKWCTNIWPLVDEGMTRHDCLEWMKEHRYPVPPRSACIKCPYHSDLEWRQMKRDRPQEFLEAVLFEQKMQVQFTKATAWMRGDTGPIPYLHASRKPLNEVDFSPIETTMNLFGRECEGMCGV
jgi:hypothetical protein